MTDPCYPQKTNYAIKPAAANDLQQILSYIHLSPHDNLGQAPFQRQPHLAISKSSIDTILQNTQTRGQDIVHIMTQDKLIVLRATAELLKQLIDSRSQITDDNVASLDTKVLQCENYIRPGRLPGLQQQYGGSQTRQPGSLHRQTGIRKER